MPPGRDRLARRVKLKDAHIVTRMIDVAVGLPDVIKLGRGDPDLDTPEHIVQAGQEALASGATHYTHPLGLPELRTAIADNIAAHGGARRVLGYVPFRGGWVKPKAARLLRQGQVWTDKWGWLPRAHLSHYEKGRRRVKRRYTGGIPRPPEESA